MTKTQKDIKYYCEEVCPAALSACKNCRVMKMRKYFTEEKPGNKSDIIKKPEPAKPVQKSLEVVTTKAVERPVLRVSQPIKNEVFRVKIRKS